MGQKAPVTSRLATLPPCVGRCNANVFKADINDALPINRNTAASIVVSAAFTVFDLNILFYLLPLLFNKDDIFDPSHFVCIIFFTHRALVCQVEEILQN